MSIVKIYGTDLAGKQAKWKDQFIIKSTNEYSAAVDRLENKLRSIFTDESGAGGLTVQQKFDALGTDGASLFVMGAAGKSYILALNPSYVAPTPADYGYTVVVNQDGTVTIS